MMAFLQSAIGPIAGLFHQRGERKKAVATLAAKGQLAKDNADAHVTASIPEWEAIMAKATMTSWKDEAALVTLLLPIWAVFIGGLIESFTGITALREGAENMMQLIPMYGALLVMAIGASFGLKIWKG